MTRILASVEVQNKNYVIKRGFNYYCSPAIHTDTTGMKIQLGVLESLVQLHSWDTQPGRRTRLFIPLGSQIQSCCFSWGTEILRVGVLVPLASLAWFQCWFPQPCSSSCIATPSSENMWQSWKLACCEDSFKLNVFKSEAKCALISILGIIYEVLTG